MGAFNVFDIPYIMTEGGPANSTNVIALHIYIQAFKFIRLGYGTRCHTRCWFVITLMALLQLWVMSRRNRVA